jgi:hypothetical protein
MARITSVAEMGSSATAAAGPALGAEGAKTGAALCAGAEDDAAAAESPPPAAGAGSSSSGSTS